MLNGEGEPTEEGEEARVARWPLRFTRFDLECHAHRLAGHGSAFHLFVEPSSWSLAEIFLNIILKLKFGKNSMAIQNFAKLAKSHPRE